MRVTPLSSTIPFTTRQRAAEILRAWLDWRAQRAARLARVKLDTVIDGFAFGTLLLAWATVYVVLCPAEPIRHHAARVASLEAGTFRSR